MVYILQEEMKTSLRYLGLFLLGVPAGILLTGHDNLPVSGAATVALYLLLLTVGFSLGADPRLPEILRSLRLRILFVPLSTIAGTFLGVSLYNLLFSDLTAGEAMAAGLGMGYYSLSSIILTDLSGEELGVIALLANIARETLTLLLAPFLPAWLGALAPISSGGATSMDTTLPVILQTSGKQYVLHAMVHGVILTILVPFLVSATYRLF